MYRVVLDKEEKKMVVREKYEQHLVDLNQLLIDLCEMAIRAFDKSVDTFLEKDINQAMMILEQDQFMNRLEQHIQDEAILLITKQQPVATDLRRIMMIVSAASDMERIGDHAVNIAKETIRLGDANLHYSVEKVEKLRLLTKTMLEDMLAALATEDLPLAKAISKRDDEIDQLYGEAIVELVESAKESGAKLEQIIQLSFICKSIERIGDYTTNLAEGLFFLLKGTHRELNS